MGSGSLSGKEEEGSVCWWHEFYYIKLAMSKNLSVRCGLEIAKLKGEKVLKVKWTKVYIKVILFL